jgi:hypothetical protein
MSEASDNSDQQEATPAAHRGPDGRFPPGTSGNPAGRPRGARNKRTAELAELLDAGGGEIVGKLIARAKAGRPWAMRLAIERLLPKLERRVEIDMPAEIKKAADVAEATATVIGCAARGEISLEEANAFLKLVEQQRRAIETNDLAVRLELLEREESDGGPQYGYPRKGDD